MLSTIWEDIDNEAEAIVLSETKYEPSSLSNKLYDILDDRDARRKVLKNNKIPGLFADLHLIRDHSEVIMKDETLTMLVESLFKKDEIASITSLDRVFLNSYCRRLLRAKVEKMYLEKELIRGLVVTEYTNGETDKAIIETMMLFRIVCRYLGISSTIDPGTFSIEKLYMPSFWFSMTSKFVCLFGETRVDVIEADEQIPLTSAEAYALTDGMKDHRKAQVFTFLNIIFNAWSGSTLIMKDKYTVQVVPATYVTRMLPKLGNIGIT
jgi:hypothetical protein